MDCRRAKELLEARLDGEQVPSRDLDAHLAECPRCQNLAAEARRMHEALQDLPVEGPRPGFLDEALARATEQEPRRRRGYWPLSAAAAGLVAGLAVGVLLGGHYWNGVGAPASSVELVAGGGAQPVKLMFDAPRSLSGVELTLSVEGDVAIDGYTGERTLSWRTDLDAGKNLLTLPVLPTGTGSGVVVARLHHDGMERTFRIQVDVRPEGQDGVSVPVPPEGGNGRV